MKRHPIILAVLILILSTLACGVGGPIVWRNNEIRQTALAYELSTRGTVDEVLVAFGLTEVRDNLGFKDGNTVWLNPLAERDYFRKRDPDKAYLFLYDLDYADGAASILIDRGDSDGVVSRRLGLQREDDTWEVVSDELLEPPPSPSD
jgi:hypothetical protein